MRLKSCSTTVFVEGTMTPILARQPTMSGTGGLRLLLLLVAGQRIHHVRRGEVERPDARVGALLDLLHDGADARVLPLLVEMHHPDLGRASRARARPRDHAAPPDPIALRRLTAAERLVARAASPLWSTAARPRSSRRPRPGSAPRRRPCVGHGSVPPSPRWRDRAPPSA